MKSIFNIKNPLPFDADVFERMKKSAVELLDKSQKREYTQAIVLLSRTGREYGAVIEDALSKDKSEEKTLIDSLFSANDTKVNCILCMWQDDAIDIPSFAFRKMLLEIDPSNNDCGIFVTTADGFSVIRLENTMK